MKYEFTDGSKVFFTSDTHFGHQNIIRFCNRPWATIAEHDQALIDNWNAIVPEDAVVFHLGDFCYKGGGFPTIQHLIGLLHGQIVLIRGNHDPDTRKPQNLQQLQQIFEGLALKKSLPSALYCLYRAFSFWGFSCRSKRVYTALALI